MIGKGSLDSSIPAAGEERFVPVKMAGPVFFIIPPKRERRFLSMYTAEVLWQGFRKGDDLFCKRVNEQLKIHVMNVEYRLAPEVMFPGDKEDVYDGFPYLCSHRMNILWM